MCSFVVQLAEDVDLASLAKMVDGKSGSDLKEICKYE